MLERRSDLVRRPLDKNLVRENLVIASILLAKIGFYGMIGK